MILHLTIWIKILKYLLNKLVSIVRMAAEEINKNVFNGSDIDQTRLYVKKNCGKFIRALIERHEW